jgi:hypothetical protein
MRLQQIESMRSDLQVENWRTQAKIEAIEAAMKRGGSREALNLMIGQIREARDDGFDRPRRSPLDRGTTVPACCWKSRCCWTDSGRIIRKSPRSADASN